MEKIKIGILGTSDIAFRRFLPALMKNDNFEYVGVASRNYSKTKKFIEEFGGEGYEGYDSILSDVKIDAVYIPLPPALHYKWAMKALDAGKHIFVEKPSTVKKSYTDQIIKFAKSKELAVHENYMFVYHSQLRKIKEMIDIGILGEVRLYRIAFGFPKRPVNDFRYNRELGGGALLDCGGYPVKLASELLGKTAKVSTSKLNYIKSFEVDMYGNATLENSKGQVAQISFGMDNSYKCELEVWGSKGTLATNRIFTAGDDFMPEIILDINHKETIKLDADDHFLASINQFYNVVNYEADRLRNYDEIIIQSKIIEDIKRSK